MSARIWPVVPAPSAQSCSAISAGCVPVSAQLRASGWEALAALMKTAFFALRAIHALETGEEIRTRAALAARRRGLERDIALGALGGTAEERAASLFNWAAAALRSL